MNDKDIAITLVDIGEVRGATAINRRALRRLTRETISVDMNVKVVPDTGRSPHSKSKTSLLRSKRTARTDCCRRR